MSEWSVGEKVALYGPHSRKPDRIATIEKIYKTGHVVVGGRRFKPFGSGYASETGDGYARSSIRKCDAATVAEVTKRNAVASVAKWLSGADINSVPDDALAAMVAAMNSSKQQPNT